MYQKHQIKKKLNLQNIFVPILWLILIKFLMIGQNKIKMRQVYNDTAKISIIICIKSIKLKTILQNIFVPVLWLIIIKFLMIGQNLKIKKIPNTLLSDVVKLQFGFYWSNWYRYVCNWL